jgi:hypothetical protein
MDVNCFSFQTYNGWYVEQKYVVVAVVVVIEYNNTRVIEREGSVFFFVLVSLKRKNRDRLFLHKIQAQFSNTMHK